MSASASTVTIVQGGVFVFDTTDHCFNIEINGLPNPTQCVVLSNMNHTKPEDKMVWVVPLKESYPMSSIGFCEDPAVSCETQCVTDDERRNIVKQFFSDIVKKKKWTLVKKHFFRGRTGSHEMIGGHPGIIMGETNKCFIMIPLSSTPP